MVEVVDEFKMDVAAVEHDAPAVITPAVSLLLPASNGCRFLLRDVLLRISTHPADRVDELLPDRWSPQN